MSTPIHTKEQHLDYLQKQFGLIQQMVAGSAFGSGGDRRFRAP
ncbi:hypothetical protein [Sinobaca sp. H24]|nr:hypothetical protein [Sinobaca sp. H24]